MLVFRAIYVQQIPDYLHWLLKEKLIEACLRQSRNAQTNNYNVQTLHYLLFFLKLLTHHHHLQHFMYTDWTWSVTELGSIAYFEPMLSYLQTPYWLSKNATRPAAQLAALPLLIKCSLSVQKVHYGKINQCRPTNKWLLYYQQTLTGMTEHT